MSEAESMASLKKRSQDEGELSQQHSETASVAEPQAEDGNRDMAMDQYLRADPNHVRDIVLEARKVRKAMGKPILTQVISLAEVRSGTVINIDIARESKAAQITVERTQPQEPVMAQPKVIAVPVSEIDREIEQFAYGRTAYSSIDIIDFIRYLKDKGYSFQEYIVLEKIYVKIEQRKKETRSALEKEVEGLFSGKQVPQEPDISRLIGRLRDAGLVFEEEDVRRMVRLATQRRA